MIWNCKNIFSFQEHHHLCSNVLRFVEFLDVYLAANLNGVTNETGIERLTGAHGWRPYFGTAKCTSATWDKRVQLKNRTSLIHLSSSWLQNVFDSFTTWIPGALPMYLLENMVLLILFSLNDLCWFTSHLCSFAVAGRQRPIHTTSIFSFKVAIQKYFPQSVAL